LNYQDILVAFLIVELRAIVPVCLKIAPTWIVITSMLVNQF